MNYELVKVNKEQVDILINYKLDTVINDNNNLSLDEKKQITNYVSNNSLERLNDSKFIICDGKIIGCLVYYSYEDGILLDELYLCHEYRGFKIGTNILKNLINNHRIVYLWVYKNNDIAFNLYRKLNFKVIDETETRYFMKYLHER